MKKLVAVTLPLHLIGEDHLREYTQCDQSMPDLGILQMHLLDFLVRVLSCLPTISSSVISTAVWVEGNPQQLLILRPLKI